jgi:fatty-acyl-CoA synthase
MSGDRIELWVEVDGRGDVEHVRRAGVAVTFVTRPGRSRIYGRPDERLCVWFEASPSAAGIQSAIARLPIRAGAIAEPDHDGLALISALSAARRSPVAASVRTVDDARSALAAGASTLVVDVDRVAALVPAAGPARVVVAAADLLEVQAAVDAGAGGVLVEASLAIAALERGILAERLSRRMGGESAASAIAVPVAETIGAALDRAARRSPGHEALIDVTGGGRWSYERLRAEVRSVGRALVAAGVGPGDRVALWARALPEWPLIQLATGSIGAVLVTVNPSAPDDELKYVIERSGARLLVGSPHHEAGARELARIAASRIGSLDLVVAAPSESPTAPAVVGPGILSWKSFVDGGGSVEETALDRRIAATRPDDVASVLFTSGTTGFPKGAALTHKGLLRNASAVARGLRLGALDRLCLAVPFHHCFGSVMGTLATLVAGSTLVLPARWFDAAAVLAAVGSERCTVLYGVPTMFIAELEELSDRKYDLSSLRTGIISGAPVPSELAERASRELHLPELVVAYGLTEASPVVTMSRIDDPPSVRFGSVGRPIPGAEVRIVDPTRGAPLGQGVTGELCTRGVMVMRGYWDDVEASAEAIDADGWLHTGDLASRDARGDYRIVGRAKDLIIRGGENIYPAEIETVARRHPAVGDVHVVGISSDFYGEEVVAFVRLRSGIPLDVAELRAFLAEHLAPHKVPREIRVVAEFPMTASGKIQKHRLRELAAEARSPQPDPVADPRPSEQVLRPTGADAGAPVALPLLPSKGLARDPRATVPNAEPGTVDRESGSGAEHPSTKDDRPQRPAPPRAGWARPDPSRWVWTPRDKETQKEVEAVTDDIRRRGTRIKTWGIGDDVEAQIEATGEAPIMYKALGTPVRTGHPFNLYGDIRSQPDALRGTFESGAEIEQVARQLAERNISGIIGLGSGTSQFVAQVANAAFERYAGIPAWDYDSLAFLRYPPPHDWQRTVAVGYSGSGSTVDTVAATSRCHDAGAFTLAFTSIEGSPVVRASDARILTAGGFDTGGSDTFHYTTRIAAAIYLAIELGRIRRPGAFDYDGLKTKLLATADQMATIFEAVDARCQTIAEQFLGVRSILTVGDGPNYGTAEEIALKFDEMAHIPTKPMSPGRHIHGALGLTDEEILTILVAPPGSSYDDQERIAKVTQILKTPSVAIVSEDDRRISEIVDYVIRLPVDDEVIFPVLAVLPGQLIPYWCGVGLGLNPDTQRSNVPKHARAWHMLFPPGTH